jgi:RNA polymerase sigma factor (sigma-70 family)
MNYDLKPQPNFAYLDKVQEEAFEKDVRIVRDRIAGHFPGQSGYVDIAIGEARTSVLLNGREMDSRGFRAKLYVIALNKLRDEHRRCRRVERIGDVKDIEEINSFSTSSFEMALVDKLTIEDYLTHLSAKGCEAIRIHFLEGYSQEQTADRLGISLNSLKDRIRRALKTLRRLN